MHSVLLRTSRRFNTHLQLKTLVAIRDIKRGEPITVKPNKLMRQREFEEQREIDRLARVAYEHARRSG
jgi:hypothetical protein